MKTPRRALDMPQLIAVPCCLFLLFRLLYIANNTSNLHFYEQFLNQKVFLDRQ